MKDIVKSIKFIHVLTIIITGSVFLFDLLLCYHNIPEQNKSIIDFIAGVLNGTCLGGAFAYWYNTTAGSKEKTKELVELAKNAPVPTTNTNSSDKS